MPASQRFQDRNLRDIRSVYHATILGGILGSHMGLEDWRVDICSAIPFHFTIIIANDTQLIQRDRCSAFSYATRNRLFCLKCHLRAVLLQLIEIGAGEDGRPLGLSGRVRCTFELELQHSDASFDIAEYPSHRPGATFQLRPENRILSITSRTRHDHVRIPMYSCDVVPVGVLLQLAEGRKGGSWSWDELRLFTWNSSFYNASHTLTSSRRILREEGLLTRPEPIPIDFFERPPIGREDRAGSSVYGVPLVCRRKDALLSFYEGTQDMRVMSSEDNLVVWEVRLILLILLSPTS